MNHLSLARLLAPAWIAALVLGLGAGALLWIIAAIAPALSRPSWAATLDVVAMGTMVGIVGGTPYLLLRALTRAGGAWAGAILGLLVLAVLAALLPDTLRTAAVMAGRARPLVTTMLVLALFIGWGIALEKIAARVGRGT